jgi:hypothetical protein
VGLKVSVNEQALPAEKTTVQEKVLTEELHPDGKLAKPLVIVNPVITAPCGAENIMVALEDRPKLAVTDLGALTNIVALEPPPTVLLVHADRIKITKINKILCNVFIILEPFTF